MDDLKERLRDAGYVLVSPGMRKIAHEAAARIEALEAKVKEAGEALETARGSLDDITQCEDLGWEALEAVTTTLAKLQEPSHDDQ